MRKARPTSPATKSRKRGGPSDLRRAALKLADLCAALVADLRLVLGTAAARPEAVVVGAGRRRPVRRAPRLRRRPGGRGLARPEAG